MEAKEHLKGGPLFQNASKSYKILAKTSNTNHQLNNNSRQWPGGLREALSIQHFDGTSPKLNPKEGQKRCLDTRQAHITEKHNDGQKWESDTNEEAQNNNHRWLVQIPRVCMNIAYLQQKPPHSWPCCKNEFWADGTRHCVRIFIKGVGGMSEATK